MAEAVIVAGARTPIGKLSGALAGFTAMDLGGFAIAEALIRAGVSPDQVDYVLMGQVILAGQGQITARQAAVKGGIPMTVPANTINKVCLSGLNTIYLADQMIRAGDAEIVVAGGMESMTQAPHLLPGARAGFRIGDATLVDSMMYDGLTDSFDHIAMGLSTEQHNDKVGITRDRQDPLPPPVTRRQPRRPRRAGSQRRSSRCRYRSARATPCWSTPTRACDRAPQRSRWVPSSQPLERTAPSRLGMPRRSPTVRQRSS